ncbi:MAG TPA: hypothetical protein VHQ65_01770 [Thermoanaerobaculia bacterium]|nr:hypothetical protein [Thermoanaerobaculia bacterium]
MRISICILAAIAGLVLVGAPTAEAQWCQSPEGAYWCGDPDACIYVCGEGGGSCDTPCKRAGTWSTCGQMAGNPANDLDGDAVLNTADNCLCTPNTSQANCDGDGAGDVCDSENANYQQVSNQRCWIDHDEHVTHYVLEDYWERRFVDFGSCGAPDKYERYLRDDATCAGFPPPDEYDCCINLIVPDHGWCSQIDQNFCH